MKRALKGYRRSDMLSPTDVEWPIHVVQTLSAQQQIDLPTKFGLHRMDAIVGHHGRTPSI